MNESDDDWGGQPDDPSVVDFRASLAELSDKALVRRMFDALLPTVVAGTQEAELLHAVVDRLGQ